MAIVGWWASDEPLHLATGRRLGERPWRSRRISVSTEHRTRHLYCVGSSGSGKSRFARHLLYQEMQANRGFTLVDPQDLTREILAYIAELALPGRPTAERVAELGDKLVIIEPTDQRFGAPGVNVLQIGPGQVGYQVVDAILEVIAEIWPDFIGPRMEDVCRNALLLLQELGLTVLEIVPLLSDAACRQALVNRSRNPQVRLFFEQHLAGLRAHELKVWFESSRNKWNAFLANPFMRPILGQAESTIDFRAILNDGKWLLVNISRDKLKESRRLFGALIVALIDQAAIAREDAPPERRYFHALYVDEFQEFWTPSFLRILESGRKYGLGMGMFHQNLTQPPFGHDATIVDTIIANAHTRVVFNVARKDADRLAGELFAPSAAEIKYQSRLLGIPTDRPSFWSLSEEREHYVCQLMQQQPAEAFISFKGVGDDEPYAARISNVPDVAADREKVDLLRRHVAAKYYRPLAVIEQEIRARWEAITAAAPAGGRDFTQ